MEEIEEITDKLGKVLAVGDRIVYATNEEIKVGTILGFPADERTNYNSKSTWTLQYVKVIADGATKGGKTYPRRIIKLTQELLKGTNEN
jgi:hypothetical protein